MVSKAARMEVVPLLIPERLTFFLQEQEERPIRAREMHVRRVRFP